MQAPASPQPEAASPEVATGDGHGHSLGALSLGALGVVYGDIGTSPLYAIKECLGSTSPHAVASSPGNVLGVMSLVFWALTLVVVVKYLGFVLRADNRGEGGILALAALIKPKRATGRLALPILLALFGAGLLYGDGLITPAISVLSAVEGLEVATDSLQPVIVPATVAILVTLFVVQRHGTHRIGSVFGWVMLVWFLAIGAAGVRHVAAHPEVLAAINPVHGVRFFAEHGVHGFLLLGAVVLCVTGGEALYADMGHFGKRPIRVAWFTIAMPGLLLNYFGQAALLLSAPEKTIENPFFALVHGPLLYPMVVIATLATIIASQALISGAFSLTQQAVQLGYLPRVTIVHTSEKAQGQIYIPEVNWFLMVGTVLIVIGFGSSSNLAAAYGIAVTGTMAITTYLYYLVARRNWGWPLGYGLLVLVGFMIFDLSFLGANVVKIQHGGWVPLVLGTGLFVVMTTWWKGRLELSRIVDSGAIPDDLFLADLDANPLPRVRGTAVFMTSNPAGFPNVLLHHVKHNQVLHEQVVLLSIETL
ncbi:MAG TPA: KUP/HAK/KT family potassium transporter, partial [Kofleriaceae bacterium]|nr:KUP/HAK/KT family potassium transporter [Kofleriaceae bacterium]